MREMQFTAIVLMTLLTLVLAWITLSRQAPTRQSIGTGMIGDDGSLPVNSIPQSFASTYKLTSREMEVINLFSQGYSLAKVSRELYISLGTAQSHIKSVYRKLDIHSKDELISLIDSWKDKR